MAQYTLLTAAAVLIVENEAIVRMELAAQLSDFGFKVFAASTADEAIDLLEGYQQIEILLTDVTMPGSMDGVQLAHHVRKRWPAIKIVVTSGRPGTALSDLPAGSKFFAKPYDHQALRIALTPFIAGNKDPFSGPTSAAC